MLLCRIIFLFLLLFSNVSPVVMNNTDILNIMSQSNEIIVYKNNSTQLYEVDSKTYNKISNELQSLALVSRESPAFGVSLHNETLEALKTGYWIEFVFDKTITHNDMPFDSLLINVVECFTGFNIIRKYQNKYDGRCFYVDLIDTDMSSLENIIKEI